MNKQEPKKQEPRSFTTLMGKLFLTPKQRKLLTKWGLFSLVFLLLQVLQDALFSRTEIFGGCPDIVPAYLLLVCFTQETGSGAAFLLGACVFRCLCGTVMGSVSLAVLVFGAVAFCALRHTSLWGKTAPTFLCTFAVLGIHQLLLFFLGIFLGHTLWSRLGAALGGLLGQFIAVPVFYPLTMAIGRIGGKVWND